MSTCIEVKNLTKSFSGRTVVDNLSFQVQMGEVFGLLGHNGAGKSTTIDLILGLKKADKGSATIFGKNPAKNRKAVFERVGVQLQSSNYQNNIRVGEICRQMSALYDKPTDYHQLLQFFSLEKLEKSPVNKLSAPVLIKKLPEVVVCSMKKRIESYDELFHLMPEMGEEMTRLGCVCAEPEYCFTNYLEPGELDEDILIETCEAVTEKKEDSEKVQFQVFPEVPEAACIFHRGSYDTFSESYAAVLEFIEENGYEICGNIRESYIDGVWNKEKPEEWLSEIQIPVRKI